MLNLRKSANVGSEKIRRSFPRQICFVFLFSLHDCSHPSSQRYHLPISGSCSVQRTAIQWNIECNSGIWKMQRCTGHRWNISTVLHWIAIALTRSLHCNANHDNAIQGIIIFPTKERIINMHCSAIFTSVRSSAQFQMYYGFNAPWQHNTIHELLYCWTKLKTFGQMWTQTNKHAWEKLDNHNY